MHRFVRIKHLPLPSSVNQLIVVTFRVKDGLEFNFAVQCNIERSELQKRKSQLDNDTLVGPEFEFG
jgi:hypothetical protein